MRPPDAVCAQLIASLAGAVAAAGASRVALAVSGGMDSSLLLHLAPLALPTLRSEGALRVLHVNHGLAAERDLWSRSVELRARQLGLGFRALAVSGSPPSGESVEAWLRVERYRLLAAELDRGEALLVAQHLDDQAETFLLQALRAAGPAGLAAMPVHASLATGLLLRPWLGFSRAELAAVANAEQLAWHDDPSNADTRFDRNHLRQLVMPILRERWPAAARTLARTARWQAEASEALAAAATCLLPPLTGRDSVGLPTLHIPGLLAHAPSLQRVLLRAWLAECGACTPGIRHIEVLETLLASAERAPGCVGWGKVRVRRYRDQLYCEFLPPTPSLPAAAAFCWQPPDAVELSCGRLWASLAEEGPERLRMDDAPWLVAARRGGERIRPIGERHTRSLKGLLQRAGVPPWRRSALPLIYRAGVLIAVPGLCVAAAAVAPAGEPGWVLHWEPSVGGAPTSAKAPAPARLQQRDAFSTDGAG